MKSAWSLSFYEEKSCVRSVVAFLFSCFKLKKNKHFPIIDRHMRARTLFYPTWRTHFSSQNWFWQCQSLFRITLILFGLESCEIRFFFFYFFAVSSTDSVAQNIFTGDFRFIFSFETLFSHFFYAAFQLVVCVCHNNKMNAFEQTPYKHLPKKFTYSSLFASESIFEFDQWSLRVFILFLDMHFFLFCFVSFTSYCDAIII